jgi:hypothetical protein
MEALRTADPRIFGRQSLPGDFRVHLHHAAEDRFALALRPVRPRLNADHGALPCNMRRQYVRRCDLKADTPTQGPQLGKACGRLQFVSWIRPRILHCITTTCRLSAAFSASSRGVSLDASTSSLSNRMTSAILADQTNEVIGTRRGDTRINRLTSCCVSRGLRQAEIGPDRRERCHKVIDVLVSVER